MSKQPNQSGSLKGWAGGYIFGKIKPYIERLPAPLKVILALLVLAFLALFAAYAADLPGVRDTCKDILRRGKQVVHDTENRWDSGFAIAVYYPDPSEGGSPSEDGLVQKRGFDRAVAEFRLLDDSPDLHIERPYKWVDEKDSRSLGDRIIDQMRKDYAGHNARVFILTMSSAALAVKPRFVHWRRELQERGQERPILVATVSSAPQIAASEEGIYRLYIRSQEESSLLAEAAWVDGCDKMYVLYITRTLGESDSKYGNGARDEFIERLDAHGVPWNEYEVVDTGSNAAEVVRDVIADSLDKHKPGVFVVGYGTMLKTTLEELLIQDFKGPFYCASTLHVPHWQPDAPIGGRAVTTVTPVRRGTKVTADLEQSPIYFFAAVTLWKALKARKETRTLSEFERYFWSKLSNPKWADCMELTTGGDAVINLRLDREWQRSAH